MGSRGHQIVETVTNWVTGLPSLPSGPCRGRGVPEARRGLPAVRVPDGPPRAGVHRDPGRCAGCVPRRPSPARPGTAGPDAPAAPGSQRPTAKRYLGRS